MKPIYLDYNATTPIDEEVSNYMIPFLKETFGNPSSLHQYGTTARLAIGEARKQVAELISCSPAEIVFTSGGTEANNMALIGSARANRNKGNHIITSDIEHPAILEVCKQLEKEGFEITYLRAGDKGKIDPAELEKEIRKETILVSIMHANNETGIIQPIAEISQILKGKNILLHTDAAQTPGKIPVNVKELGVELLSLAAHKFYGPKGVGALYIKEGIKINKIFYGADHERNLRPGTENLLEIAGMGKAAEIAHRDLYKNASRMKENRDQLFKLLSEKIPGCIWNGNEKDCLPNTLNISFPGLDSNTLLSDLPDIAISAGAACHADDVTVSHVLEAMNIPTTLSLGTVRISTGKRTTAKETEQAGNIIAAKVLELTGTDTPLYSGQDSNEKIKLTRFTQGMGCACKISPKILEEILKDLPIPQHPDILVGTETSDDAAVYRLNDTQAVVQTLDFFTPIVDDPFEFGEITAANALSDLYAMGAKPLFGLNIVAFPQHRLPLRYLKQILEGATQVANEAGIALLGGHTITDNEPKFGLVVTGLVHPDKILKNKGACEGDAVFLTKKIGTGILSTAIKRNLCKDETQREVYHTMRQLNKYPAEILQKFPVTSCTDVTGFGLLGHLKEICSASGKSAYIKYNQLPLLNRVEEFASEGIIPGGTINNYNYLNEVVCYKENLPDYKKYIATDAQTSGGLLFTVNSDYTKEVFTEMKKSQIPVTQIGTIHSASDYLIYLE